MNGVCGTLSVLSSARYLLLSSNLPGPPSPAALRTLYFAHLLPILGFGFDALDGKVARWMGGGSMLGQEMDSLADLVSFGVAPATLAFTIGLRTPLDLLALLFFVSGGLARLARFNATVALIPSDTSGKSKYFEGLPIPSSLALTSMMAYWVKQGWYDLGKHGGGELPLGVVRLWGEKGGSGEVHVASGIFAVWAAMMVSKTLRVVELTWADATPPVQVMVIPIFDQPYIYDIPSSAQNSSSGQGSYPIELQLSADQNYVVVLSDATGFGSGGSSEIQATQTSNSTACLSTQSSNQTSLDFTFSVAGIAEQCQRGLELTWSGGEEDGPYNMTVVPCDQGFFPFDVVLDTTQRYETDWVMNMTSGSRFTLVFNSGRGRGRGGSAGVYQVSSSTSSAVADCNPVSMTTGQWPAAIGTNSLAAGTYAVTSSASTSTSQSSSTTSTTSSPSTKSSGAASSSSGGKVGGIVGGVVVFFALLGIFLWLLFRRRRKPRQPRQDPLGYSLDLDGADSTDDLYADPRMSSINPYDSPPVNDADSSINPYHAVSTYDSPPVTASTSTSGEDPFLQREASPLPRKSASSPPTLIPMAAVKSTGLQNQNQTQIQNQNQGQSGNFRVVNNDPSAEPPALPPGAEFASPHPNANALPRRRNEMGGLEFRRHVDAGRVQIEDLPPMYTDVPRDRDDVER
ncbi:CDP-diacylglycerol---serine O-phosphatidyltransferase, partial [Tremellales sp. Uapishka_1]